MLINVYTGGTVILPRRNFGAISVILSDESHQILFQSGFRVATDTGESLTETTINMYQILIGTLYAYKYSNTVNLSPAQFIVHTKCPECSALMSGLLASWNLALVKIKWSVQEVINLLHSKDHMIKFHFSDPCHMHIKALGLAQRALVKGEQYETSRNSAESLVSELPQLPRAKVVG